MAIMDEIREQQKKMTDMSFKGKCKYFWDYYKVHTIVTIAVVLLLVFCIKDIMTGNQESVFQVAIINSEIQEVDESYEKGFEAYLGIDPKKQQVILDNSYRIDPDGADQMTVASSQKMVANMQLALIDTVMASEDVTAYYAYNSFVCDIREILPEKEFEKFDANGRIFYAKNEEGQEIPVGIKIDDSKWLQDTGLYKKQTPVLSCVANTTRRENIVKFIDYIYNVY